MDVLGHLPIAKSHAQLVSTYERYPNSLQALSCCPVQISIQLFVNATCSVLLVLLLIVWAFDLLSPASFMILGTLLCKLALNFPQLGFVSIRLGLVHIGELRNVPSDKSSLEFLSFGGQSYFAGFGVLVAGLLWTMT